MSIARFALPLAFALGLPLAARAERSLPRLQLLVPSWVEAQDEDEQEDDAPAKVAVEIFDRDDVDDLEMRATIDAAARPIRAALVGLLPPRALRLATAR
jgi:hypothetical protein